MVLPAWQELRTWEEELTRAALQQKNQEELLRRREQELAEREIDILERELNIIIHQLCQEKPRVKKRKGKFRKSRLKLKDGNRISLPSGWCPRTWGRASQVALVVKNPPANAGDVRPVGSTPGSGRSPGGGHGNPLQYCRLENPHRQRSLAGYSPWGHKELETTEATEHAWAGGSASAPWGSCGRGSVGTRDWAQKRKTSGSLWSWLETPGSIPGKAWSAEKLQPSKGGFGVWLHIELEGKAMTMASPTGRHGPVC